MISKDEFINGPRPVEESPYQKMGLLVLGRLRAAGWTPGKKVPVSLKDLANSFGRDRLHPDVAVNFAADLREKGWAVHYIGEDDDKGGDYLLIS